MKLVCSAGRLYGTAVSHMDWPQSILLFILRLAWGIAFMETGWGKLHNLAKVTEFFASLHIPFPGANAAFVGTVELVGGLFLTLGLLSRLAALPLSATLIVAYLTDGIQAVQSLFTKDYMNFFAADPWPFLLVCLVVIVFGPGKISLDALLPRILPKSFVKEIAPGSLASARA